MLCRDSGFTDIGRIVAPHSGATMQLYHRYAAIWKVEMPNDTTAALLLRSFLAVAYLCQTATRLYGGLRPNCRVGAMAAGSRRSRHAATLLFAPSLSHRVGATSDGRSMERPYIHCICGYARQVHTFIAICGHGTPCPYIDSVPCVTAVCRPLKLVLYLYKTQSIM